MINKYKLFNYLVLLSIFLLAACGSPDFEGPYNTASDPGRTGSYEETGPVPYFLAFADYPEADDKSGAKFPPLPIGEEFIAMSTAAGSIVLTEYGRYKWEQKLDSGETAAAAMCADDKMNIYLVTNKGNICSYDILGKKRWKTQIPDIDEKNLIFSDLLAVSDGILSATEEGQLLKFDFNGKLLWKRRTDAYYGKKFSADNKGNIYIISTLNENGQTDSLVCIDKSGKELWKKFYPGIRLIKHPVVSEDRIYFSGMLDVGPNRFSKVFVLDKKGKELFNKELNLLARYITVSNEGDFFVLGYNSGLGEAYSGMFCFDKDGKKKWDIYFDVAVPSAPAIDENKLSFIGRNNDEFGAYFISRDGRLIKIISLSDFPVFNLQPVYQRGSVMTLAGSQQLCLIRVDDTRINKFLDVFF